MRKSAITVIGIIFVLIIAGCISDSGKEIGYGGSNKTKVWGYEIVEETKKSLEPVKNLFKEMESSFRKSIFLVTNPSGFSYTIPVSNQESDSGLELEMVTTHLDNNKRVVRISLKNKGDYDSKNVKLEAFFPENVELTKKPDTCVETNPCVIERNSMKDFIYEYEAAEFSGFIGLGLEYGYESDSTTSLAIISDNEWKRLAQSNELEREQVISEASSSPVILSIGTLDQPIKEEGPFYIGLNLSMERPDVFFKNVSATLEFPDNFGLPACTPPFNENSAQPYHWETLETGKPIFCQFASSPKPEGDKKTHYIKAHAYYTITHLLVLEKI